MRNRFLIFAIACLATMFGASFSVRAQQESIRLEIPVVPGLQKFADLLERPGYVALILENNELSPSLSSKLRVREQGRSAEIRNAVFRFTGRKDAVFSYEAGITFGIGDTKLTLPVTVDLSGVESGSVAVMLTLPLAKLIPNELTDRIRMKIQSVANVVVQRKVLNYLDQMKKEVSAAGAGGTLGEAVLADAYNRGVLPSVRGGSDVGDAVPLSDQWLLILTLVIWLIVVPAVLVAQRFRRNRQQAS